MLRGLSRGARRKPKLEPDRGGAAFAPRAFAVQARQAVSAAKKDPRIDLFEAYLVQRRALASLGQGGPSADPPGTRPKPGLGGGAADPLAAPSPSRSQLPLNPPGPARVQIPGLDPPQAKPRAEAGTGSAASMPLQLKAVGYYKATSAGNIRDDDKKVIGTYVSPNLLRVTSTETSTFSLGGLTSFKREHSKGREHRTARGWIKSSNIGDQFRVVTQDGGTGPRLWRNQPASFTTNNTHNTNGDSIYTVTATGYSRIAPVNTERSPDEVLPNCPDSHMCFIASGDKALSRTVLRARGQVMATLTGGTQYTVSNTGLVPKQARLGLAGPAGPT